jgi:hypothetical protein
MIGGMGRAWKEAYRTNFSYRRVYDELSLVATLMIVGAYLLVVQEHVGTLFGVWVVLAVASETWGREALWRRIPPHVRRELPKEPLDAKAVPGAIAGYRDLYRAWAGRSAPRTEA